jgi:hypothetical protein
MARPIARSNGWQRHLPERLPVGATYVVEGHGGAEGNFRAIARYVVLPSGQRINVPVDTRRPAAARALPLHNRANAKQSAANGRYPPGQKKIASQHGTGQR